MFKILKSFGYAGKGVAYAFRTQLNFKIHTLLALVSAILGWYVKLEISEWLWIIAAVFLVIIAELFNTALEVFVDLVSPEFNPKAGAVKDVAAAAVLLTSILAVIIGIIIFVPKFHAV